MVTNGTNQSKGNKVIAIIGRWEPLHNGHKSFIIKFARDPQYTKVIILIGSCYENGTLENCIPAIEREKMLRAVLKKEDIPEDKFEIIPVSDYKDFDKWFKMIRRLCYLKGVTHFCTGNKEDILDVLNKKGENLEFEIVNPEENSDFPFHATDIRRMILRGDYESIKQLIPNEIMSILFKYSFKEIVACSRNAGIHFNPGRQTVKCVFLIRNIIDGKVYVLLGKRDIDLEDSVERYSLPGGFINEFETSINAIVRNVFTQTGIDIEILDNSMEPAIIRFNNIPNSNLEQMHIVGIYSDEQKEDEESGVGSSQCFGIFVEDEMEKFREFLCNNEEFPILDFYEVGDVCYKEGNMINKAITMFNAYPDLKK